MDNKLGETITLPATDSLMNVMLWPTDASVGVSFPNSPDIGLAVKTCIKPIVNTFGDVQFPELDVAKLSKVIENKPLKPAFFKDRYYLMKYVTRNPHIYTNWLKEMQ